MIEASFATQYGIRLRNEDNMSWAEFSSLLAGLMPETPLGQIIQIRSEEDPERLKNFTPEQNKIRNEWRMKLLEKQHVENRIVTKDEAIKANENVMKALAAAFGNK